MTLHRLAGAALAAALLTACAAAPRRRGPEPRPETPADAERWDRAACRAGEYPPRLDARAFARARQQDVRAQQRGEWSPFATARLQSEREDFDARCDAWRALATTTRL
jgi:hypothetical protein